MYPSVCCYFSCVWLFVTLWTVAYQAPLSMGFSRQEYWSRLSCPPPRGLPDSRIEPAPLMPPALAGKFFSTCATWEAQHFLTFLKKFLKQNKHITTKYLQGVEMWHCQMCLERNSILIRVWIPKKKPCSYWVPFNEKREKKPSTSRDY